MSNGWNLGELSDFGVLRLRGPDGVKFLQGQVSNDVERLTTEQSLLAGYHNPQGRTLALLRLVMLAPDDLLALLPRELASTVATRLSKFILRAKVKITEESSAWRISGLVAPYVQGESVADGVAAAAFDEKSKSWAAAQFADATAKVAASGEQTVAAVQLQDTDAVVDLPTASALMLPDTINSQSSSDATVLIRAGTSLPRWLVVSPAEAPTPLTGCAPMERNAWRLLDIADGIPQVHAATSEEFVAQMLNLDVLNAIAFDKGCYTGQEVIARAHYRGRVKRRLQRFMTREATKLAPGDSGELSDGRTFKVVDAAVLTNGRCEFLAVAPIAAGAAPDDAAAPTESAPAANTATAAANTATATALVDAEQLPLPYNLPA
jgi:tRNA-modifying protein YgfZ